MSDCDIFVAFAVEHGKRKSLQENLKGQMVFIDINVVERFVYEMYVLQQINTLKLFPVSGAVVDFGNRTNFQAFVVKSVVKVDDFLLIKTF